MGKSLSGYCLHQGCRNKEAFFLMIALLIIQPQQQRLFNISFLVSGYFVFNRESKSSSPFLFDNLISGWMKKDGQNVFSIMFQKVKYVFAKTYPVLCVSFVLFP